VAGDQYTFTTTTASFTSTDLTNAFNALVAQPYKWSFLHIVGPAATVGAAATLLAAVDLLMGTAASSYRFARAILEVPSDTDANILSAFAASSSLRVAAAAGFVTTVSVLNGRSMSRPLGWHMAARAAAVPPQEDLGRVTDRLAARRHRSLARRERDAGPRQRRPLHHRHHHPRPERLLHHPGPPDGPGRLRLHVLAVRPGDGSDQRRRAHRVPEVPERLGAREQRRHDLREGRSEHGVERPQRHPELDRERLGLLAVGDHRPHDERARDADDLAEGPRRAAGLREVRPVDAGFTSTGLAVKAA
jgi:hypothetical protein